MYCTLTLLSLSLLIIAGAIPSDRENRSSEKKHAFGIYRGRRADVRNYPYSAAIFSQAGDTFLGNGVVLNRNWVLVTAYQIDGYNAEPGDLIVRVGSNDASAGGQTYGVSKVVGHSNYTGQYYSDIALLKTSKKIIFTATVNRLALTYIPPYNTGILTGYGSNEESSYYYLRDANSTVIPYDTCVLNYNFLPTSGVFCADSGYYTAADDDLGAPLVRGNMLIGTYLGGYGTYPGIFNDVLYYKDWINNQIRYN